MKQRWLVVLFAFVAVVATVTALTFYRENLALRRLLAAAKTLESEPAGPVATSPEAPAVNANVAVETVLPPPVEMNGTELESLPPPPDDERFLGGRGRALEAMSRALNDPDARGALLTRFKANVDRMFGDLFVRLGLDEVRVEALRTVLAERQLAQMEAGLLMRSAETDQARDEARAWRESKLQSFDASVNAILGPEGVQTLRDYQQSAPQRSAVADVNRRATYSGAALSPEASDQLVSVLRGAQREYPVQNDTRRGDGGFPGGRNEALTQQSVAATLAQQTAQNQAVLEQARGFLTNAQLEALADKQLEEYEALQQQLDFQLRNPDIAGRGFIGGGPPDGFPPGGVVRGGGRFRGPGG